MADSNLSARALVRRMRVDDAEAVAQLLRAAYGTPDAGAISVVGLASLPLTASRVRRWHQACAAAWTAEVAGFGPVGAVFAVVEPGAAWMAGLGVAPCFRGAGVGAALTDHAHEFLAASGRAVTGMEAAATAVGALGLYVRRGFRPADLTVRLRGVAADFATRVDPRAWRESECPNLNDPAQSDEANSEPRIRAQPYSSASYLLVGPGVTVLCDPDPLIPAAEGCLDLRLVAANAAHACEVESLIGAAARSASLRGLALLDVDLALADGVVLGRLLRLGLAPIASTIRLVSDLEAYVDWRSRNGPIGRWSL